MKKRLLLFGVSAAILLTLAIVFIVRGSDPLKLIKPDPGFRDYINGYTSGVVSVQSSIKVQLTHPFADSSMMGQKVDPSLFSFSPVVSGTATWIDSRTVQFVPNEKMKQNTTYTCSFQLFKLMEVPKVYREFVFQYHTIKQDYEVELIGPVLEESTPNLYKISGSVMLADVATFEHVKEMVSASYDGVTVGLNWGESQSGTRFSFNIDSLVRKKTTTVVSVSHSGKNIGLKKKGVSEIKLPGTNEFIIIEAKVAHKPDPYVEVVFSDLLNPEDDFDGMVRIGNLRNLRYMVEGNILKVYPESTPYSHIYTFIVEAGVKNITGKKLGTMYSRQINFASRLPGIRLVGEGTILPSTNGMVFPFEAIYLKAVDVKVQKIYEKNVPQFLQINDLDGSSEMYRVATTVYNNKVDLRLTTQNVADFSQWNRYAIDLTKLITPERGAIYRVILSFRKAYSVYPCTDSRSEQDEELTQVEELQDDKHHLGDEGWYYTGYYDYDWYDYEEYVWSERKNPCHSSYYRYNAISKNILSSDLGLIAKGGADGTLTCFVTDILTAKPLEGINVEVIDYRMQTLSTGVSDKDGKVELGTFSNPFLIIARRGDERGYLKLGSGNSLSLSLFDVDGERVKRGVKGFLYGERGVWRPGDTMFINFILENKLKKLPEDIPVMFQLSDPQGNVVRRIVSSSSVNGIYPFHVWTDESAVTGNYLGEVIIGNLTYSRYFKVETVKPNRLKIELTFPGDRIDVASLKPGKLESRWLHGAISSGLRADVSMTLSSGKTKFPGFEAYNFDNPATRFYSESVTIFDDRLDNSGRAELTPAFEMDEDAPGVLQASFKTKVFEPGGDFSINHTIVPFYPFSSYAGLWVPQGSGWWDMIESGKQHTFQVANVDSRGKGLSSELKVRIFRIDWSWWWHNTERDLPYFLSNSEAVPVFTANVKVKGGKGSFTWGVSSDEWGKYFIVVGDPASGHATGKSIYIDSPGWGRRAGQGRDGASMLSVTVDKPKYKVGDKVNVTIPSSPTGNALISLENGSEVLRTEWVKTDSGTTRYSFDVTAEMAPNIYVHVTLLQPHKHTVNDMPIRMYGVVPVVVDNSESRLKPEIITSAKWEAGSTVSVSVQELTGKPMAYTLAIVDEGLLDLTNFKTPDPWRHFYGKEALGVQTWDLYSEVIGAWTGGFPRLLAIGGGDVMVNHDKQKTQRFTPVVKVFGPIFLPAGKKETHTFKMPQYVGSVKIMVVAANEGAYGNAEKVAEVKSPLMVLGTLPRVIGPGETVELPVNVFAMEKEIKEVKVTVTPKGLFKLQGAATQTVSFKSTGDQVVNYSLKVGDRLGEASVEIVATSAGKSAKHNINLEVRNPIMPRVTVIEKTIPPGQSVTEELLFSGIAGTQSAELELSVIPPINFGKRLDYLITYPHGCLEQIVSSAFPQLLLKDVIYLDKQSLKEIDANIKGVINSLISYMDDNGTFAYWPNSRYHNEWAHSWTGHFLIEAERRGYAVPQGMKRKWIATQKRIAKQWQQSPVYKLDDLVQAYRLYTLALAGSPEMGAMNRLKEAPNLTQQARWRLAAAYALAGKIKTAKSMVAGLSASVPAYNEYSSTFGTPLRDRAMAAEAMVLIRDYDRAFGEVQAIAKFLNSDTWYNTQTTAYALVAVSSYFSSQQKEAGIACNYSYNGKSATVKTDKSVSVQSITEFASNPSKSITIKNNGNTPLNAKVIIKGVPLPEEEKASDNKLKIKVEYLADGKKTFNPAKIEQGKDFMVKVTVTNPTADYVRELALSQIFPSGWQIHNSRLSEVSDGASNNYENPINFQDIRDDRVLTYFNLNPRQSKTFVVMLNATYAGRFYMPAIHCSAMYVSDVFAQTAGKWVEVTK